MPEIARFYGIVIKIFFGDHPPPHFHAVYGEHVGWFDVVKGFVTPQLSRFLRLRQLLFIIVGAHVAQV